MKFTRFKALATANTAGQWRGPVEDRRAAALWWGTATRGTSGAPAQMYPEAAEQRCWPDWILNVVAKLPKRRHADGRRLLTPTS